MTSSTSSFKALGLKAAAWLALLVSANLVAREPVRRLIENPVRMQKQNIAAYPAPTVLLGDSHAAALGESDQKLLNLAQGGDSFAEMRAKLDYVLRQGHLPQRVILQLDWHSFSSARAIRNNRQQGEMFTDQSSYQRVYGGTPLDYALRHIVFSRLPILNPINGRLARRYLLRASEDGGGRAWSQSSPAERLRQQQERLEVHFAPPYDPEQVKQVQAIVKTCRERNIAIIGVRLPLLADYAKAVSLTDEYARASVVLEGLGIQILDLNQPAPDPGDFQNQDHLAPHSPTARSLRQTLLAPTEGNPQEVRKL